MGNIIVGIEQIHEGCRCRIKDQHKARIYSDICNAPEGITRKELVEKTGMRPSTISDMTNQLVADNLVREQGRKNEGMQGRPEILLHPNYQRIFALALYIVSRELKGVLVDAGGSFTIEESRTLSPKTNNSAFVKAIYGLIDSLYPRIPEGSELVGVSITLPGYLNLSTKTWSYVSRWPKVHNISFARVEEKIGLPVVVNRALDAELNYLINIKNQYASGGTLLFHWGYGIGASFAYDGVVMKTSIGSFCEVGHLVLYPESGKKCACGAIGCLETAAALWALIPELETKGLSFPEEEEEFENYFNSLKMQDHVSVKRAIDAVAQALSILQTIFLPDRIVTYGPLLSSKKIFSAVVKKMKQETPAFAAENLCIDFIDKTFEGDIIGGTTELFTPAFRKYLTAD